MSLWLRAWGPAAAWAALIFAVSSRPTLPVQLDFGRDKLAHFAAYLVLGLLLGFGRAARGASFLPVLAVGLGYGLSDELHQSFVPGRSAEFGDWVADALGTLVGLLLFHLWRRRRADRAAPAARAAADSNRS